MERTFEFEKLHNIVNYQSLIYYLKGPNKDIDFNDFIDAETLFDDINSKKMLFEGSRKNQIEFKLKLSSVKIGGNKSNKQLSKIENFTKYYKS